MKTKLVSVVIILFFIFGCKDVSRFIKGSLEAGNVAYENDMPMALGKSRAMLTTQAAADSYGISYSNLNNSSNSINSKDVKNAQSVEDEKKIIKSGSINVSVINLTNTGEEIDKKVKEYNGYIESSSSNTASTSYLIKVPAEKFDTFFKDIGKMGVIISASTYVEDVTTRYYDLENRLKNMRILQARFQSYLATAKNVEELLKVEKELYERTTDLENFERSFKALSKSITYSTVNATFSVPGTKSESKPLPPLLSGFKDFGIMLLNFLYGLLFFILGLIFIGIPIVFLIAVIYYVTFGKLGLIKILFKKLSSKDGR